MKQYRRSGKSAIFCRCRKMLLIDTPEERVRQKFINYLIDECGVPESRIKSEKPICHFVPGVKGRADIVVYRADGKTPILVIETKALGYSGAAIEQAERYARAINAKYIGIACCEDPTKARFFKITTQKYRECANHLHYEDLVGKNAVEYRESFIGSRIPFSTFGESQYQEYFSYVYGEDTDPTLIPHFLSLWNFLMAEKVKRLPTKRYGIQIVEDKGITERGYGNAAGGNWHGYYRSFILKDKAGDHQLVSLGIIGIGKTNNDAVFGNRSGKTCLVVAIDDFDNTPHNAQQYRLDDFVVIEDGFIDFWHDGKMTAGKSGSVSRPRVLEFVRANAPHLILQGQIFLGSTFAEDPEWADAGDFVFRLISYALTRDALRAELRSKKLAAS